MTADVHDLDVARQRSDEAIAALQTQFQQREQADIDALLKLAPAWSELDGRVWWVFVRPVEAWEALEGMDADRQAVMVMAVAYGMSLEMDRRHMCRADPSVQIPIEGVAALQAMKEGELTLLPFAPLTAMSMPARSLVLNVSISPAEPRQGAIFNAHPAAPKRGQP